MFPNFSKLQLRRSNALCQVVGMQNAATARATSMQRMQVRHSFLIIVAAASAATSTIIIPNAIILPRMRFNVCKQL